MLYIVVIGNVDYMQKLRSLRLLGCAALRHQLVISERRFLSSHYISMSIGK